MRIRYTVPFTSKTRIPDHWPFPVAGGIGRVIEVDGVAQGLEVVFDNQPLDLAPTIRPANDGVAKYELRGHDHQIGHLRFLLDQAMGFLQCFFGVGLATDEIKAAFEPEHPGEEGKIQVHSIKTGTQEPIHHLNFSMLTRAVMAAAAGPAPVFEAALLASARDAMARQRFIDSFRYSFLLIEFLFGDGKFKGEALKAVFRKNDVLKGLIQELIADPVPFPDPGPSSTATLLAANPSVGDFIDHLVDQRGFYFHGNIKRKDTWKPEQQTAAKLLAFKTLELASRVGQRAADPLFDEQFTQQHFQNAKRSGAIIVLNVSATFIEPDNGLSRQARFSFTCPGTKLSAALLQGVAREFLGAFERQHPVEALRTVSCVRADTGEKAFEMTFYSAEATQSGDAL